VPITVVVRSVSGGEEAPSLTFDGGRVAIGRSDGCDVRLPDPSVSLRHATIRAQGTEYALVDEGSTNGTWVGGVRLNPQTPRLIRTGDLVRIGRVWLEIAIGTRAPTPDLGLATRDLALSLVRRAMNAVGDDTVAKIRITEGPDIGNELRLLEEGRAYLLGRAEKCDLPLADEDASREHAVIVRRGGQVLVRDLASRNGVFLGDMRLSPQRDVVWKPPTMARIGLTVIALDEPVSAALLDLEAAADEPLREADVPPAPASVILAPPQTNPPSGSSTDNPPSPASVGTPESQRMHDAPIAEIAPAAPNSRNIPTVPRGKPRRVWTAADILVVTVAIVVIGASIAGLIWVLK
jgi:pSer/pThr/pTyr-binding forkhead associated (FHA) protein